MRPLAFIFILLPVAFATAQTGHAATPILLPHRTSYCVAAIATLGNRDFNSTDKKILGSVQDFKNLLEGKLKARNGGVPWTPQDESQIDAKAVAHDSDISLEDSEETSTKLSCALDRLHTIESDAAANTNSKQVLLKEYRGKDAILARINSIEKDAADVEKLSARQIKNAFPYWNGARKAAFFGDTIGSALFGGVSVWNITNLHFQNFGLNADTALNFALPAASALGWAHIGKAAFKDTWKYTKALFSEKARIADENESDLRIAMVLKENQTIRNLLNQPDNAGKFVFYGFKIPISPELKEHILAPNIDYAKVRDSTTQSIAILRRAYASPAYIRMDSIFYFDPKTNEPVLVTTTRL